MDGQVFHSANSYSSWARTYNPPAVNSNGYNPAQSPPATLTEPRPFEDSSWHPTSEPHPPLQSTEMFEVDNDKDVCVCAECGKIFSNNNTLDIHAERTNHRAFGCKSEGCNNTFSSLASLHRHCKDHEAGVFVPCPFCDKQIRHRRLQFHLLASHQVAEGRSDLGSGGHHCRHQTCAGFQDYHFLTEFAYFQHLRQIHHERLRVCDYPGCERVGNRGFLGEDDLLRHQATHITLAIEFLQDTVRSLAPLAVRIGQFLQITSALSGMREVTASGKQRIFWTCQSCQARLFDDFIEIEPGSLCELEKRLNSNSFHAAGNTTRPVEAADHNPDGHSSPTNMPRLSLNNTLPSSPTPSDTREPRSQLGAAEGTSSSTPPKLAYLLCCVPRGRYGVYLYQEMLEKVKSDRALFEFLRSFYYQRRFKWYLSHPLRTINKIKLVRFLLTRSGFVDVQTHEHVCTSSRCICLPPPEKVEPTPGAQYRCQPVPPAHIPPIGENFLMHLFSSPSCIDPWQTWVLLQFPKRTSGKLRGELDVAMEGWGLLFQEGWDWSVIWSILLVFFVLPSIMFLVVWSILKDDIQGASSVAAYWVAVGTIFIGYIATRDV